MSNQQKPSYWAVIPAEVRRDDALPANAKLLYGDISALTNEKGYCYATNSYFQELYGWTERTVQRLIMALADRGYIRIEQIPGVERRIYAGVYLGRPPTKKSGVSRQKSHPTPDNFVGNNNVNIDSEYIPPKSPQGGRGGQYQLDDEARGLLNEYVRGDPELADAMVSFMEVRVAKKAVNSARAIKTLLNELDRLSGKDRELKLRLVRQSIANSWKSVFPLDVRDIPAGPPGGSLGDAPTVRSSLPAL